jgi:ferric-dicitrate binding protein FerR (iron transport regulator)
VEGAVKVLDGNEEMLLRPGQQALLGKDGGLQLMENIDMPGILAWKTGMFRFRGADIYSVMRQVARWYDVSVQYEGGRIGQTIYGTMPRSLSAASMFKVLEEAGGVHFKIEGKKVVVTP